ncbi:MAG: substrate-binding domain-containing protein [Betaproteobacteria bacterium]|nr:substrate-binding domain-containing protein [Betaproteobacteria bacterium]
MATRQVLADLADTWRLRSGVEVAFEATGGVDAAKRCNREAFDVVALAADAIDKLIAAGCVIAGSKTDLVRSEVAIAVRAGAPCPDIASEDALRRAVLSARMIGYSTGPSGAALSRLFERWGVAVAIRERLVQAAPGVPVGRLLASGEVELGFQQHSELMHEEGICAVTPARCRSRLEIVTPPPFRPGARRLDATGSRARISRLPELATADAKRRHAAAGPGGLNHLTRASRDRGTLP